MKFDMDLFRAFVAEFCAASILISIGCLAAPGAEGIYVASLTVQGLNWGFAALAATHIFFYLSGAHLNPCITLAAMVMEVVNWKRGLLYILAQLLGTILGLAIAYGCTPGRKYRFCMTLPGPGMNEYKTSMVELYLTATWTFVMLAAWHPDNEDVLESVSIRIGLSVACISLAGIYFTGASMNPFRSLIAAIFEDHYDYVWIYIVVPLITSVLIACAWRWIYTGSKKVQKADD